MWNMVASSAADSRAGFGEEAAGEHLERQMPCGVGEVDGTQEAVGVEVVEPLVDVGHRHRGQRRGGAGVEPDQVAQPERRAAQRERQRVQRRRLRQAAEGVAPAHGRRPADSPRPAVSMPSPESMRRNRSRRL